MQYVWSVHAECGRLPERSGLSKEEIERRLELRVFVKKARRWLSDDEEERHLIWDEIRGHLIDIPLVPQKDGSMCIPTVLPVANPLGKSNWIECVRADAERTWRGREFYIDSLQLGPKPLGWVEVVLAKQWVKRNGWIGGKELLPLLSWPMFDPAIAQTGDEGVLALLRELSFCRTIQRLLQQWENVIPALTKGDKAILHIKKPGAHRYVPFEFFLSTP